MTGLGNTYYYLLSPTTFHVLRGWSAYKRLPNHAHYIQTYLHRNSSGPAAARSRLDRAEQIRNTCKRLTYLEDKLHPLAKAIKLGTSIFVFSLLVELQADCLNFCDGKKLH
jgi:hypothetical protein